MNEYSTTAFSIRLYLNFVKDFIVYKWSKVIFAYRVSASLRKFTFVLLLPVYLLFSTLLLSLEVNLLFFSWKSKEGKENKWLLAFIGLGIVLTWLPLKVTGALERIIGR